MAKSLRSKWARARRHDKRVKYAKKELAKLKELVSKREMREEILKNIETVAKKIKVEPMHEDRAAFQVKQRTTKRLTSEYNPVTLKNKHGNYPPWMNRRALIRFKSTLPIQKKKRNRKK